LEGVPGFPLAERFCPCFLVRYGFPTAVELGFSMTIENQENQVGVSRDDVFVVLRWSTADLTAVFASVWTSHRYRTRPLLPLLCHPPAVHPLAARRSASRPACTLVLPSSSRSHSLLARGIVEQRAVHLPPARLPLLPSYTSLHLPFTPCRSSVHLHSISPHSCHIITFVPLSWT
jgi:hypothetical protein